MRYILLWHRFNDFGDASIQWKVKRHIYLQHSVRSKLGSHHFEGTLTLNTGRP